MKIVKIGAEHSEHRRFFEIWNDCFTSPKIVLGVAYGKDAGGVEEKL